MELCRFLDHETAEQPLDCDFHPSQDLLAVGLIDGGLQLLQCSKDKVQPMSLVKEHEGSCRAVAFHQEGRVVISGSANHGIVIRDVQQEKILAGLCGAHDAAISRLRSLPGPLFAAGDEDGGLKIWDTREKSAVQQFTAHTDYISDVAVSESDSALLAVSGDGCLSINDMKAGKVREVSDGDPDDELTSVEILKGGKKIICGSQTGILNIFSWGKFADYSDRFPGHPSSVDAIVKFDEDTIITGSSDGVLRVLTVQPHSLIGILGEHDEFGCERLALSHNQQILASTSFGPAVRFWDTACLTETSDPSQEDLQSNLAEEDQKADSSNENEGSRRKRQKSGQKGKGQKLKSKTTAQPSGFFADL